MIKIRIFTYNKYIMHTKLYFLLNFCKIYNLTKLIIQTKKTLKTINLLRSPHIHKKTWKKYKLFTYYTTVSINFKKKNIFIKLHKLLTILNNNCKIIYKLNYYN